ncbi:MAG TPA: SRPBCC family protein [Nocardioides sp.]|nr:SRPBCC family protein [Nocardioides sp.]
MSLFVNSAVIAAPRERVFDYVAERENEREWNPECKSVEKLTDGPIGVGSRWRAQWKGSPVIEVETTEYDRPNHMTNHNGGPLEVTVTFTCGPADDDNTRLDVAFYAQPHGAMRLMFPLFERRFRKQSAENVGRIKAALEAA